MRTPGCVPILCVLLWGWGAHAGPIAAQIGGFGQNKIQYRDFDWHVLSGDHVDVYFYPAEEEIARTALRYAEESYKVLERRLSHDVRQRIPLIVYASHSDFEQTNVLPFVPPEGILGVTEFLKRRVAMPFRGSYSEFRNTLRHELVHVFQLSMLARQATLYPRIRRPPLPLWWSEGLAEFMSSDQDSRDDMVVRDLTLSARLPSIDELGSVHNPLVYPVGGELHRFLASRYGAWRVNLLHQSLWKYASFAAAMEGTYGRSTEQLSEQWHYDLRQRYFPEVSGRKPITLAGNKLADLALKPVAVERRDTSIAIAYLSPRSGYTNIYLKPLKPAGKAQVIVAGERSPEFESLHAFSSRIDVREGVLLFASKYGDRDAVFFWNIDSARVVGRYHVAGLVSILSPAWSPDGQRIAFSALSDSGVSDVFTLEMATGALTRVTLDRYEDLDPAWLPDGKSLVFASDRAAAGASGARNLYRIDLATRAIVPLTSGDWVDEAPRWDLESGRIIFTSDRDGTFNVYSVDTLGNGRAETKLDGGVFDPAPLSGDARIAISGFSGLTWSLYVIQPESLVARPTFAVSASDSSGRWTWSELADPGSSIARARRYQRQYSLDFAAGVATTAPGASGPQGAQFVLSDLLGDHVVALSLASYQGSDAKDLLANINGNLFYLNQSRRINWGLGLFRIAGTFYESDFRQLYQEKSAGIYGTIRYPLSRYTRVEGHVSVEHSTRNDFANALVRGATKREGTLTGNFLSVVRDNALWLDTGPIDGTRWNLTGGVVSDLSHGAFENWLGQADVRRYMRTSQQSAIALRGYAYASEGTRPRAIQIAGSWMLRGYPRYSVSGTRAWLANTEWRFPITNFVAFGFPFGVVRFPRVEGAIFADAGQAWTRDAYDPRVLASAGLGLRMSVIPGLVLRLDAGRRISFNGDDRREDVRSYFRRRFVDLFFGFDY